MPFSDCSTTWTPGGDVVRHQRRQPDAEVDVLAVAQLGGHPGGELVAGERHASPHLRRHGLRVGVGALLDRLAGRRRPRRRAARRRPGVWTCSGSSSPGSTSSSTSAIVIRPAIAHSGLKLRADSSKTRLPCRSPRAARTSAKSVTMAVLQHVLASVERRGSPSAARRPRPSRRCVAPRQAAVGDLGADAGRGVERRDARSRRRAAARPGCPAGVSSTSSSPERYCRANSLFSPDVGADGAPDPAGRQQQPEPGAVDAAVVRHRLAGPALPCSSSASIRPVGMPHRPKPPTASDAPSGMSATASAADAYVLSIPLRFSSPPRRPAFVAGSRRLLLMAAPYRCRVARTPGPVVGRRAGRRASRPPRCRPGRLRCGADGPAGQRALHARPDDPGALTGGAVAAAAVVVGGGGNGAEPGPGGPRSAGRSPPSSAWPRGSPTTFDSRPRTCTRPGTPPRTRSRGGGSSITPRC